MKKTLLLVISLSTAVMASAQVLESDNYNAYTLGNVSGSVTAAGQGGMLLYNGAVSDYQIVSGDAAHGKYLAVTGGSDGTAASSRYVYKSGLNTSWAARTAGNNIIKGSFEVFTGTSTNKHLSGLNVFGAADGIVGIGYNSQTKTINGQAYLNVTADSTQNGFYSITGLTASTFPANTWVTLGFSYNKNTGAITYVIGGTTQTLAVNGATTVAGLDPAEVDVFSSPTRTSATDAVNSGPTTFGIDNYVIQASNNAVLATSDVKKEKSSIIAIGPNPASEYINILTDLKINKAEIYDMAGRKVNAILNGNSINIKDLTAGSYIIVVETANGKTTEKFIKK